MARLLPVLAAVLCLALGFVLPDVGRGRLATLSAHQLLGERVGAEPAEGAEDTRPTLTEALLESSAARLEGAGDERRTVLQLYGSRLTAPGDPQADLTWHLLVRRAVVRGLRAETEKLDPPLVIEGELSPAATGANFELLLDADTLSLLVTFDDQPGAELRTMVPFRAPSRRSVIPPLVAIALAILFRRPLLALFLGVLSGAFLLRSAEGAGALTSVGGGILDVAGTYFWAEITTRDRIEIVGFVVCMLGMVGVMTRAGGVRGMIDAVARIAKTVRATQLATWIMGLVIFFDDYANTILVGSTMRPLTDRFKIAREKLAYIVDSTAAPVAGLSIFSTWIAFEVSTFSAQLPAAGLATTDGYAVFLQSLPYRFYCLLTLAFVGLVALTGRDFGPMLTAERRARSGGGLVRKGSRPMISSRATTLAPAEGVTPRAWRAILPLVVFLGATLFEIARRGGAFGMSAGELFTMKGFTTVLYDGSGNQTLLVGSASGMLVAVVAALLAGLTGDIWRAAWATLRSMGIGFGILYLAWMIGAVCRDLGTATYLSALLGDTIPTLWLPSLLFLLAGAVAFATGSSWSTMSILLPLVIGLAYTLGLESGLLPDKIDSGRLLMVMCIGAVLEGSIFGDHCSPISDTTVLSSIASASDHIDHVRTQAPYAVLTMVVAMVAGYIPAVWFGMHPLFGLALGIAALLGVLLVFGRKADAGESAPG